MGHWIAWVIGVLLFLLFLWIAVCNAVIVWEGAVRRRKTGSWVPLLGGIAGAIALAIVPIHSARHWWWLPLFLDLGCIPLMSYTLIYYLVEAIKNSKRV